MQAPINLDQSPVVYGGHVFFATQDGFENSVGAFSGAWEFSSNLGGYLLSPAITQSDQPMLVFGSGNGKVYGLRADIFNSLIRWQAQTPDKSRAGIPASANASVIIGDYGGNLTRFDYPPRPNLLVWTHQVGGGPIFTAPAISGNHIYVGTLQGLVKAFDIDGNELWSLDLGRNNPIVTSPAVTESEKTILVAAGNLLVGIDTATHTTRCFVGRVNQSADQRDECLQS